MRIAIIGGSFDPIHKGHLQIAKYAKKKMNIDEVWFMPTWSTPLKEKQHASFHDRCAMIKRAIRPYRYMKLSTVEERFAGYSYTIQTMKELRRCYPKHQFCWLLGDDQAKKLDKWKDIDELKSLVNFFVFSRDEEVRVYPDVKRIQMPLMAVSSSDIRRGDKLSYLPYAVHRYIGEHYLYLEEMVQARMSEKRYLHSLSVAALSVELAKAHGLDTKIAYIAGLTHDICKQMPYEKSRIWMQNQRPYLLGEAPAIWHAYVGAYFVQHFLHIQNKKITNAIYNHVTGQNLDDYERILYIADKLDPSRGYDSQQEIALSKKSLRQGFRVVKEQQETYLSKKGIVS